MVMLYSITTVLILSPFCTRIEKRGISPSFAAFYSIAILILIVLLLLSVFIPYLAARTVAIIRRTTSAAYALAAKADRILNPFGFSLIQNQRLTGIIEEIAPDIAQRITSVFARSGIAAAEHAGRLGFSLVISYYILCERKSAGKLLLLCGPLHDRTPLLHMLYGCRNAVLGYLTGLIKTCIFIGAATYIGLVCIGVPDAPLLAVFMGVFELFPYAGPVLASIPILISAASLGWERALLSLGLTILVQLLEGNIVSPYFSASSTDIHPLAVVISIFVGGSFFGFWGILLAVPAVVIGRCIFWAIKQR